MLLKYILYLGTRSGTVFVGKFSFAYTNSFENKKFVDITQQYFEFSLKVKVMGSNPGYLLKYFLL